MPPRVIGPYRILETLGSGGVGTVYRAIDRRTGDSAAVKLLSTGPALDPRAARRLAREFETLQDLSHPNVVRVYDTGVYQGYPYLAMELVEGLTLKHYLTLAASGTAAPRPASVRSGHADDIDDDADDDASSDEASDSGADAAAFGLSAFSEEAPSEEYSADEADSGPEAVRAWADLVDEPMTDPSFSAPLSAAWEVPSEVLDLPGPQNQPPAAAALANPARVSRIKDVMLQICQALAYIHGKGLIHRDLKPSNIMVDDEGIVRLMDFGLAKFLADDAAVTADGRMVGTFRYMAPEQVLGEQLDARTDLYSLGVILYELLAGRPPFDAKTPYELWQKVLETEPIPLRVANPLADKQLARVAHRLIRKEPGERLQTAEEVYEALSE